MRRLSGLTADQCAVGLVVAARSLGVEPLQVFGTRGVRRAAMARKAVAAVVLSAETRPRGLTLAVARVLALRLDQVGDYAEERFRAALYDAFLAEPIRIFVEATVDIANDLAKDVLKGIMGGGSGGGLGQMLGQMLGLGAQTGGAAGQSGATGGLSGFSSLAANWNAAGLLGQAGIVAGIGALGSQLAGSITGALGGNVQKAQSWGWLGGIPGLIAGLTDKADRPYARADVEVQNGKFVLAGSQAADGGDKEGIAAAGKALAEQLNALSQSLGIDLSKVENLYTTLGKTQGGNAKALGGDGFFGGAINGLGMLDGANDVKGWTLGAGVKFSQGQDAEAITEQIIRDTLLRAINAGASDLSEAEKRFIAAADSLDEAIAVIDASRGFGESLDDMLLELLDPAAFEKKKALDAVEATYQALKAEAEKMIGAGLLSADVLDKIEQLRDLQLDAALRDLEGANGASGNPFADVRDSLQAWLDGLAVSDFAPGGPKAQRDDALAQYQRVLTLAQMGDQNALASLTTYAERLLRADREATGSATQRQGLYDQVTKDIAALVDQIEPLTPSAISGPIVEALGASQTAVAQVLKALPPEIAAPLLAAILREPDWAAQLLGENVQVPPALAALREQVMSVAPEAAGPIVAAVLATPAWTTMVAAQIGAITPSIELVRAALAGLPPETAGPIVAALTATPGWADAAIGYLQSLPPSLDLLQAMLGGLPAGVSQPIIAAILQEPAWAEAMLAQLGALDGLPPDIAGPIVAALLQSPAWAEQAVAYLQSLPPSLDLLQAMLGGLPAGVSQPIIAAILQEPAWAEAMLAQLGALDGLPPDIAGPIVAALLQSPAWAEQAVAYLQSLPPSMEALSALLDGQPAAITGPIIDALRATPAWAAVLMDWLLSQGANDNPAPIDRGGVLDPLDDLNGLNPGRGGGDRPYSRADIVAQNGQWTLAGLETADGGDRAAADALGRAITESLNAASDLFGIDMSAIEGLYTTAGYVTGKNFKALGGQGFFGGDIKGSVDYWNQAGRDKKGNTVGSGVSYSQVGSAADLAEQVVWETIQRAIAAGASDLTAAQAAQIRGAGGLAQALEALSRIGTIETPVLAPSTLAGGGTTTSVGAANIAATEELRRTLTDQMTSLRKVFEDQVGALTDATADGLADLAGTSNAQLGQLRDLVASQRLANAHAMVKAA